MGVEAIGLCKRFGPQEVLRSVSLRVDDGELVALLGPSGGGKSTVLRILAGLETADAGMVRVDGARIDHLEPAARGIGVVFQQYALFRHLRVIDNVAFGLRVRKVAPELARARASELLGKVGLAGLEQRWPDQLSGGQQQRVALARALAPGPRVLLLDEPFGALDARVRAELRDWLRRIHDEVRGATVLVTHDQEEALAIADRVLVVRDGQVEQDGTPTEIVDHPATAFVAQFVGEVNVLDGRTGSDGRPADPPFPVGLTELLPSNSRFRAVIRAHELCVDAEEAGPAVIRRVIPMDDRARVELSLADRPFVARVSREALARGGLVAGSRVRLSARDVRAWQVAE